MFGFKRFGRNLFSKAHGAVTTSLKPKVERFSLKMRFPGRIRLLNRWAKKHPKKMAAYYLVFAVSILSVNVIFSCWSFNPSTDDNREILNIGEISRNNPVNGMTEININREMINDAVSDYASASVALANRLDSLCNIHVKSRADSIEIYNIWKLLNNPKDNSNDTETN